MEIGETGADLLADVEPFLAWWPPAALSFEEVQGGGAAGPRRHPAPTLAGDRLRRSTGGQPRCDDGALDPPPYGSVAGAVVLWTEGVEDTSQEPSPVGLVFPLRHDRKVRRPQGAGRAPQRKRPGGCVGPAWGASPSGMPRQSTTVCLGLPCHSGTADGPRPP